MKRDLYRAVVIAAFPRARNSYRRARSKGVRSAALGVKALLIAFPVVAALHGQPVVDADRHGGL